MATLLVCKPEVLMAYRHHRGLRFILSLSRHKNADVQCKSNKNANGLKRLSRRILDGLVSALGVVSYGGCGR